MRKKVFLSSTGADLSDHREQIIADARGHDWFRLDAMEEWGARSRPPMHLCRDRVSEADIFVGLIGHYRGWEPEGDNGQRSITEMEYDWAVDGKKPRLMFVAPDDFKGAAPASEVDKRERQRRFRARLMSAETVDQRCFASQHTLSTAVFRAISNEIIGALVEKAQAAPETARQAPLSATASAGAAVAETAEEENLPIEDLLARGRPIDEIEAILLKRKTKAIRRMAHHKEVEAEARIDATQAAKRLGALAFLYDTAKALAAYEEAAQLDPADWEALWRLGQIYMRAGNLSVAKDAFERLIALHSALENPYYIHWSYFFLGDVEAALGNRSQALEHCERGQTLVRGLCDDAPANATWQRDLSVSYDKIGDISAARGDRDAALKAYQDGQEIFKALAARDPNNAEWQRDRSVSYEKIGDISATRGDRDAALKAFSDGLEIRERLAARDPNNAEWQRDLFVSYTNIGDISAARGDRDAALKAFSDALEIRKPLAARDPNNAIWQTDLVVSAGKLAAAGADDAQQHLANGLAILKRLDGQGKLTADQKEWIAAFEEGLQKAAEKAAPRWQFWRRAKKR